MSEYRPEGGETACWAGLVCHECGAVRDTTDPYTGCPRCAAEPDTQPGSDRTEHEHAGTEHEFDRTTHESDGADPVGAEPAAQSVVEAPVNADPERDAASPQPSDPQPTARRARRRDRDPATGRAQNARPRDGLGRPLPYGSPGVARAPEGVVRSPEETLTEAQRLIDTGMPFHAHEVLEDAWKTGPESERGLWRALAQFAVGLTHAARGNASGAASLLLRAADGLAAFTDDPPHGIDIAALTAWSREAAGAPTEASAPPPLRRGN